MPQATPSLFPLNPVRSCFVSSLVSQPPHLMGFFPLCRIGNPLCVLGSVTIDGRPLLIHTMWRCVAQTRLFRTKSHPERPRKGAAGTAVPCPRGLSYLSAPATTFLGAPRT